MSALKAEIVSYLSSQSGVLPSMMKKYPFLGSRIVAWLIGEKPVLIIGGEPASGKSLLTGELVLRHRELIKIHPGLQTSLALISYDQIHSLVCKRLAEICKVEVQNFLPEGETYLEARKHITYIMRRTLLFARDLLSENTSFILEAPLIGHRGEVIVDEFTTGQVFIMYSPAMWMRVRNQEQQQLRERSAQALAMEQIHEALLKERGIAFTSKQDQDRALEESWNQWINSRDGIVLSWDPADDEAGFEDTINALKAKSIPRDPIEPKEISTFAVHLTEVVLETDSEPQALAAKVFSYKG